MRNCKLLEIVLTSESFSSTFKQTIELNIGNKTNFNDKGRLIKVTKD